MEFHHDKHHNTYVTKLNATVEGTELEHQSLADMIASRQGTGSDEDVSP